MDHAGEHEHMAGPELIHKDGCDQRPGDGAIRKQQQPVADLDEIRRLALAAGIGEAHPVERD